MIFDLSVFLHYRMPQATDLLLQLEAAKTPRQSVLSERISVNRASDLRRVAADEAIGDRIWLRLADDLVCTYTARVQVKRPAENIAALPATPLTRLPAETVRYLMPSRYCQVDLFEDFAQRGFGHLSGGAKVSAILQWVTTNISYAPGSSDSHTTALETFTQRQGVCRDFAHVLIALARASGIPARFVSVYAPRVTPQDFHAVAEVYLSGRWHLVDPTGMARAEEMVRIGVGQDAADVAFLTSFGNVDFVEQSVSVRAA